MDTILQEDKVVHNAYICIRTFFENCHLDYALHDMDKILYAAESNTIIKKNEPADVFYYTECLEELCSAVFIIVNSGHTKEEAILSDKEKRCPDLSVHRHFMQYPEEPVWCHIPRSLTAAQYFNPYKALKKFCRYLPQHEWKRVLKYVTEYALRSHPLSEAGEEYNLLMIRLRLHQMIEACYLLHERTSTVKDTGE